MYWVLGIGLSLVNPMSSSFIWKLAHTQRHIHKSIIFKLFLPPAVKTQKALNLPSTQLARNTVSILFYGQATVYDSYLFDKAEPQRLKITRMRKQNVTLFPLTL